jgi:hypothetical protein
VSDAAGTERPNVSERFDKMRDVDDVPRGTGDVPPPAEDATRALDPEDAPLLDVMPPGEL